MIVRDLAQGAHGLVAGWADQSGVLAPWDVIVVTAPRLCRHLPSTSDLGVNKFYVNSC